MTFLYSVWWWNIGADDDDDDEKNKERDMKWRLRLLSGRMRFDAGNINTLKGRELTAVQEW